MAVWAHGCIGLYFWIRYRPWYPRAAPWLLIVAVLLPVLALLGFADGGRMVATQEPPEPTVARAVIAEGLIRKDELIETLYVTVLAVLALVFVLRLLRAMRETGDEFRSGKITTLPKVALTTSVQ